MIYLYVYSGLLITAGGLAYYSLNHQRINYAHRHQVTCDFDRLKKISLIDKCFKKAIQDFNLQNSNIRLAIVDEIKLPFANQNLACVTGHRFFGESMVIYDHSDKTDHKEQFLSFIFKHEIVHILQSDTLKIPAYASLIGLLPLIFAIIQFIHPGIAIGISVGCTIFFTLTYFRHTEQRADKIALEHCDKEELECYISIYETAAMTWSHPRPVEYAKKLHAMTIAKGSHLPCPT